MSRYRFHGEITMDTTPHAHAVENALRTHLTSAAGIDTWMVERGESDEKLPRVLFEMRFDAWTVRDNVRDWLIANVKVHPVRSAWIRGLWGAWHRHHVAGEAPDANQEFGEFSP